MDPIKNRTMDPMEKIGLVNLTTYSNWIITGIGDPACIFSKNRHQDQFYHLFVQVHRAEHLGGGEKTFLGVFRTETSSNGETGFERPGTSEIPWG